MSLRGAVWRLWQNGRVLLRPHSFTVAYRQPYKISLQGPRGESGRLFVGRQSIATPVNPPTFVQAQYDKARRVFVDNILRRVTNSLSSELRKRTTRNLLVGYSTPFFALVGVSLASGTGIITKEDELDAVCWEIREAVGKMQESLRRAECDVVKPDEEMDLSRLMIGPLIGTGANAVVHAVSKTPLQQSEDDAGTADKRDGSPTSPLQISRDTRAEHFPCALKTLFNYYIESSAPRILRGMFRETLPARLRLNLPDLQPSLFRFAGEEENMELPWHPNIVLMHCVFVDWMRDLPSTHDICPMALPPSIYPQGLSRNKTLYVLMKRYDTTLKKYIEERKGSVREMIVLLAQLLEGVSHINSHGVAHRDLKSDNILLEVEGDGCPSLVISDFGCCLASSDGSLTTPYRTRDTDIGGNVALMAPEVLKVEPGLFSTLDYSKSDVWSCGALAYEMLNGYNPFYGSSSGNTALDSLTYSPDMLPTLEGVPPVVAALISHLLQPNPKKRPSAEFAATILHVYLWGPSAWQRSSIPTNSEVLQWLLCLTTKVLCGGSLGSHKSNAEFLLIGSFLRRARLSTIRRALSWIQQHSPLKSA